MSKIAEESMLKFRKAIYGEKPKDISVKSIVKLQSQSPPRVIVQSNLDEKNPLLSKATTLPLLKRQSTSELLSSNSIGNNINSAPPKLEIKPNISLRPWYIIEKDNKFLNFFKVLTGLMAVPSVILNMFL